MYSNIPKQEINSIICYLATNCGLPNTQNLELQSLVNTIMDQNYFEHNHVFYRQAEGLAMSTLTSAVI
jgi:hypothetical protein